jgi:hypothetical protein|tara:strand:+ start:3347 stop:3475 length:129 start_codon:yes stop_codon:yes gene_type:complete
MPFYTVIFGRANVYTRGLDGLDDLDGLDGLDGSAALIFGVLQ